MPGAFERAKTRIFSMVGFGTITAPMDEAGTVGQGQIQMSPLQTRDKVPHVQMFGFQSNPPEGADVVTLSLGGNPSNTVIIASNHQTYRLKNLGKGESAISDTFGNKVHLTAAGMVLVGDATWTGNLTIAGNLHVSGAVIAGYGGADQVGLQTHIDPQGGPPNPGT